MVVCYKCGEPGHYASSCTKGGYRGGGYGASGVKGDCYRCGRPGHWAADCDKSSGYSKAEPSCGRCQGTGHTWRECSNNFNPAPQREQCYGCKGSGHWVSQCPNIICFNCYDTGHAVQQCPRPKRARVICWTCGGDHYSTGCTTARESIKKYKMQDEIPKAEPHPAPEFRRPPPEARAPPPRTPSPPRRARPDPQPPTPPSSRGSPVPDEASYREPEPETLPRRHEAGYSAEERKVLADTINKLAVARFKLKEYARAIAEFTEAMSLDPLQPVYYMNRAMAYLETGAVQKALSDFTYGRALDPSFTPTEQVLLCIARVHFLCGFNAAALDALREAADEEDSPMEKAQALLRTLTELAAQEEKYNRARGQKKWRGARAAYDASLQVYKKEGVKVPAEVQCWEVELLIAEARWKDALARAREGAARDPNVPRAFYVHALAEFLNGNLDVAQRVSVALLALDKKHELGKALQKRIARVTQLKDEGKKAFGGKDWVRARDLWGEGIKAVEDRPEEGGGGPIKGTLLLNRGTAFLKLERGMDALADMNAALVLRPDYFKIFHKRARVYLLLELFDSALQDFRQCIASAIGEGASDVDSIQREMEKAAKRAGEHRNDYYAILGLPRNCGPAAIRQAYHRKALEHHSDKGGLTERFRLVKEAYDTLGDAEKRKAYDRSR